MKITRSQLKQLIKEELEKRITNVAKPAMEEAEEYPTSDNPDEELPTSDGVNRDQLEYEAEEQYVAIFEKWDHIVEQMQEFMETKGTVDPEHAPIPLERMKVYFHMQTALDILEAWEYDETHMTKEQFDSQSPVTAALEAGAKAIGKIFGRH
jgi:hypothetical protein